MNRRQALLATIAALLAGKASASPSFPDLRPAVEDFLANHAGESYDFLLLLMGSPVLQVDLSQEDFDNLARGVGEETLRLVSDYESRTGSPHLARKCLEDTLLEGLAAHGLAWYCPGTDFGTQECLAEWRECMRTNELRWADE